MVKTIVLHLKHVFLAQVHLVKLENASKMGNQNFLGRKTNVFKSASSNHPGS